LPKNQLGNLSRRERQIMDVLFQRGRATAADVQDALPDAPGYSAVRALLRILEEKGHARHVAEGARYVYLPRHDRDKARQSAMRHLVQTFFDGSTGDAVAALLGTDVSRLSSDELERLAVLIAEARRGDA
jgi:predicted transcriptional regulator